MDIKVNDTHTCCLVDHDGESFYENESVRICTLSFPTYELFFKLINSLM